MKCRCCLACPLSVIAGTPNAYPESPHIGRHTNQGRLRLTLQPPVSLAGKQGLGGHTYASPGDRPARLPTLNSCSKKITHTNNRRLVFSREGIWNLGGGGILYRTEVSRFLIPRACACVRIDRCRTKRAVLYFWSELGTKLSVSMYVRTYASRSFRSLPYLDFLQFLGGAERDSEPDRDRRKKRETKVQHPLALLCRTRITSSISHPPTQPFLLPISMLRVCVFEAHILRR